MFKTTMMLALGAALISMTPAAALDLSGQNYVAAQIGSNTQDLAVNNVDVQAGTVAVGRDFGNVRAEVEFARFGDVQTQSIRANAVGVNAYYEPVTFDVLAVPVTPFVGAGVSYLVTGRNPTSADNDGFAYSGIVGASAAVTEKLDITSTFRYTKSADVEVLNRAGFKNDFEDKSVLVGVRYKF